MEGLSPHKQAVREHFDRLAPEMERWRRKSWYYHAELQRFCRFVIPPGASVLELGCGTGELLAAVEPRDGVGVDLSPRVIEQARAKYPDTRVVITYYNYLWEHPQDGRADRPAGALRLLNWLPLDDIENFLFLADFEVVKQGYRFLAPKRVPLLSELMNRVVAKLPVIRRLTLIEYVVARPRPGVADLPLSPRRP